MAADFPQTPMAADNGLLWMAFARRTRLAPLGPDVLPPHLQSHFDYELQGLVWDDAGKPSWHLDAGGADKKAIFRHVTDLKRLFYPEA